MKVLNTESDGAALRLSMDELDALRNALNEARLLLPGRDGADFETRVGISIEDADKLLKQLQALITEIDQASGHRWSDPEGAAQIRQAR